MKCLWCKKSFDSIMGACGSGYTWMLYKCQHCESLTATGRIYPQAVIDDSEIRRYPATPFLLSGKDILRKLP